MLKILERKHQFMFIQALECRANDDVADILSEHTAYVQ